MLVLFAVPNLFGVKAFVVSSGSMIPKFDIGSVVYVKKVEPSNIKLC